MTDAERVEALTRLIEPWTVKDALLILNAMYAELLARSTAVENYPWETRRVEELMRETVVVRER